MGKRPCMEGSIFTFGVSGNKNEIIQAKGTSWEHHQTCVLKDAQFKLAKYIRKCERLM
jgi:hypothetical protein